jgi:hypothetical protein
MIRLILFILIILTEPSFSDVVVCRDGLPNVKGEILSGGATGLLVREESGEGTSILLPWSSIRSIEPNRSRPQLQQFLDNGDKLWRAKRRLLRGDVQLSEPIFASQFRTLVGLDSKDSLLAAEGLLRVLIARGAISKAVHPWLETVRLNELGIESPFDDLPSVLHSETMLCPHLPITEVHGISQQILDSYLNSTLPLTASLANYLLEDSVPPYTPTDSVKDSLFLPQLLQASSGDAPAREGLLARMDSFQPWQRAWTHYAISKGLLDTPTPKERNAGLLHLVEVASLQPEIQPWLTGVAMLKLADELALDGFEQQAERIQFEAMRLFPTHPVVSDVIEKKRNVTQ